MPIHAPYNFVPLSDFVYQPEWHDQVTQDIPFKDGLCGTLNITITAHTPILLGEKKKDGVYPYKLPNGDYAIPGSSLRGMIRNVIEIASFGKMRIVDDKRYGIRDLYAPFYRDGLTNENEKNEIQSKVRTGYLSFIAGHWKITPCDSARIESHLLENQLRKSPKLKNLDVANKYNAWLSEKRSFALTCTDSGLVTYDHDKPDRRTGNIRHLKLRYKKVISIGTGKSGSIVFTGKMQNKHMEFVFYHSTDDSFTVKESVIESFLHIYKESQHWSCLKALEQSGGFPNGIPIFYLGTDTQADSVGLSQMYKLAYNNSIGEMIKHSSPYHSKNNHPDLAELMFGTLDSNDGRQSLKGRISFSPAICDQSKEEIENDITHHPTILNSPKPTFFPNYIRQNSHNGATKGKTPHKTYMDEAKVRGWKRYPVRSQAEITPPPKAQSNEQQNTSIQVNLNPINATNDSPVTFSGKVRFHNLKKEELGALLWALEWGGDSSCRHAIGMGKPYGLGQTSIKVTCSELIPNDQQNGIDIQTCGKAFKSVMNAEYKKHCLTQNTDWEVSEQILNLLAMANPTKAVAHDLTYMELDQFAHAKHKKQRWILNDYIVYEEEKTRQIKVIKQQKDIQRREEKAVEKANQEAKKIADRAEEQQRLEMEKDQAKSAYTSKFDDQKLALLLNELKENISLFCNATNETEENLNKGRITPVIKKLTNPGGTTGWSLNDKTLLLQLLEKIAFIAKSGRDKLIYNSKQQKKLIKNLMTNSR